MTSIETIKSIQGLLDVTQDGDFRPKSQAALEELKAEAKKEKSGGYSAVFEAFMPFIFEWEGETFENDPADPGGATKFGIDQRSHPEVNIKSLTKEQAKAIYWQEWVADGCEKLASPYAEVFFNCSVNMGLSRAKEFDAKAIGRQAYFLNLQEAKYRSLGTVGGMGVFLKGWLNRSAALRKRFNIQ